MVRLTKEIEEIKRGRKTDIVKSNGKIKINIYPSFVNLYIKGNKYGDRIGEIKVVNNNKEIKLNINLRYNVINRYYFIELENKNATLELKEYIEKELIKVI